MSLYCFNTSTIRNCGLSLREKIEIIAQAGYGAIELWVAEIEAYLKDGGSLAQLKAMAEKNELKVVNLIAFPQWASPDDQVRQDALAEAVAIFETARVLDCPYVAAPPMGLTERTDIPLADIAGRYRDLMAATAHLPVKPLLEFWGHSQTLGSLREALEIMNILDDPEVLLLADVFHMAKTPGSFELLKELNGAQLGLFHLNDYPQADDIRDLSDAERVYPGDGVAPLGQIFATLDEIGYTGMYSLELFNKGYEEAGAVQVAQTGMAKMKQVLP
jgi:2-keto-myo-inositol isomerase